MLKPYNNATISYNEIKNSRSGYIAGAVFLDGGYSAAVQVVLPWVRTQELKQDSGDFKMNPPIRKKADQEALIEGICDGPIDMIATDHAPHTLEDKQNGAPGFSGLETSFAVAHTELVETGGARACYL